MFVILYAGNIGLTSCLEDVLAASEFLKGDLEIRFVIVGEGVKKNSLQELARQKGLNNILFLPYQPREKFSEMLAAADLSLVTLNLRSSLTSLPSKIFNLMASARPILAIAPPDSELANLVEAADCGVVVPPGQANALATAILNLKQQRARTKEMGDNGRNQLVKKYSRANCVDLHEQMLLSLYTQVPHNVRRDELTRNA